MDSKLNLFDIFGILMPGIAFLFETYVFVVCLGLRSPFAIESLTGSLLVITFGYVCGITLLQLSRLLFSEKVLAEQLLSEEQSTLNPRFKADLIKCIRLRFGPLAGPYSSSERQTDFKLCYYDVIQNGKGVYTENFTAMASLHRQMIVVIFIGFLYVVSYLAVNKLLGIPPAWYVLIDIFIFLCFLLRTSRATQRTPRLDMTFFYLFITSNLSPTLVQTLDFRICIFVGAWLIMYLLCQLLYKGWNNYNFYFTMSVFKSFYLLHSKPESEKPQPPPSIISRLQQWLIK